VVFAKAACGGAILRRRVGRCGKRKTSGAPRLERGVSFPDEAGRSSVFGALFAEKNMLFFLFQPCGNLAEAERANAESPAEELHG
jgi:hypothetical protein